MEQKLVFGHDSKRKRVKNGQNSIFRPRNDRLLCFLNMILTKRVKKWPKMVEIQYFGLEMAY